MLLNTWKQVLGKVKITVSGSKSMRCKLCDMIEVSSTVCMQLTDLIFANSTAHSTSGTGLDGNRHNRMLERRTL